MIAVLTNVVVRPTERSQIPEAATELEIFQFVIRSYRLFEQASVSRAGSGGFSFFPFFVAYSQRESMIGCVNASVGITLLLRLYVIDLPC